MTCDTFQDLILDYTTGKLGSETLRDFKVHWTSCAACAETLRAIEGQEALLAALPRPKASDALWGRIQAETFDRDLLRRKPFNPSIVRWFAAAAALLIVAAAAFARPSAPKAPAPVAKKPAYEITIVDVKDRAQAGALGRLVPAPYASDPAMAIDSVIRDR
jgi:anti-sigma factor RsiW